MSTHSEEEPTATVTLPIGEWATVGGALVVVAEILEGGAKADEMRRVDRAIYAQIEVALVGTCSTESEGT